MDDQFPSIVNAIEEGRTIYGAAWAWGLRRLAAALVWGEVCGCRWALRLGLPA